MKKLLILILFFLFSLMLHAQKWHTTLEEAQAESIEKHQPILLLLTGSDWCPPCKCLEKNILNTKRFAASVQGKFILCKLEFLRHTSQPDSVINYNYKVLRQYGCSGYPTVLILNSNLKKTGEIENWCSYPDQFYADLYKFKK